MTSGQPDVLKAVAEVVRDYVTRAFNTLRDKVREVETRSLLLAEEVAGLRETIPEPGPAGKDGTSVTAEDVLPELKSFVERLVAERPIPRDGIPGKDGTSVTLEDVRPLIESQADKMALDVERRVNDFLHRAAERIPQPRDGKDADPEEVARRVIQQLDLRGTSQKAVATLCKEVAAVEVASYLKANPPKDGRDGADGKDGRDGIDGKDGEPGACGKDGRDGFDGKPGADGKSVTLEEVKGLFETYADSWALDFERRAEDRFQRAFEKMPQPKDGRDGFDPEDVDLAYDGERTVTWRFSRNGIEKSWDIVLPIPLDRGIWKQDKYLRGDGVTYGGCWWLAQKHSPKGRPGQHPGEWRLAVKRGSRGGNEQ